MGARVLPYFGGTRASPEAHVCTSVCPYLRALISVCVCTAVRYNVCLRVREYVGMRTHVRKSGVCVYNARTYTWHVYACTGTCMYFYTSVRKGVGTSVRKCMRTSARLCVRTYVRSTYVLMRALTYEQMYASAGAILTCASILLFVRA